MNGQNASQYELLARGVRADFDAELRPHEGLSNGLARFPTNCWGRWRRSASRIFSAKAPIRRRWRSPREETVETALIAALAAYGRSEAT
jgi:hypothetical protein